MCGSACPPSPSWSVFPRRPLPRTRPRPSTPAPGIRPARIARGSLRGARGRPLLLLVIILGYIRSERSIGSGPSFSRRRTPFVPSLQGRLSSSSNRALHGSHAHLSVHRVHVQSQCAPSGHGRQIRSSAVEPPGSRTHIEHRPAWPPPPSRDETPGRGRSPAIIRTRVPVDSYREYSIAPIESPWGPLFQDAPWCANSPKLRPTMRQPFYARTQLSEAVMGADV